MKTLLLTAISILAISCSDNCLTCTDSSAPSDISTTYCDDGEVNYTDEDGNILTFDELIEYLEMKGQKCE